MIIKQIYTYNNYRNFNYIIACSLTREAILIDPLASRKCLEVAKKNNFRITAIINTHEHMDHIGGNEAIIKETGAKVYAHFNAKHTIPNIHRGLRAGDFFKLGKTVDIEILDTPGHTLSHICLLVRGDKQVLFSGDTLFNAGVGNCHNGGDPLQLYKTFYEQLVKLTPETIIYPGHDYLQNNLAFTLSIEPDNNDAKYLLSKTKDKDFSLKYVSSIKNEFKVNTFFRLKEEEIINFLKDNGELDTNNSPEDVFLALRRRRNNW